jgi:hypothetical protein
MSVSQFAQQQPPDHDEKKEEEIERLRKLVDSQARVIGSQASLIRHYQDLVIDWEEHDHDRE